MLESELSQQVSDLRNRVGALEVKVEEVRGDVRVTKHEGANTQQLVIGLTDRIDRFQTQMFAKLDTVKSQQDRSAGFYAGVAAVFTLCAGVILFLVKLLFGMQD